MSVFTTNTKRVFLKEFITAPLLFRAMSLGMFLYDPREQIVSAITRLTQYFVVVRGRTNAQSGLWYLRNIEKCTNWNETFISNFIKGKHKLCLSEFEIWNTFTNNTDRPLLFRYLLQIIISLIPTSGNVYEISIVLSSFLSLFWLEATSISLHHSKY